MMPTARTKGSETEQSAQAFLEKNHLKTIACNYRTRYGEIDLVMLDRNTLVFVEVRYRQDASWGTALETVDRHKQKKIIVAAEIFLSAYPHPGPIRFDVMAYEGYNQTPQWIRGAFDAC